jgi:hypothetical protein
MNRGDGAVEREKALCVQLFLIIPKGQSSTGMPAGITMPIIHQFMNKAGTAALTR